MSKTKAIEQAILDRGSEQLKSSILSGKTSLTKGYELLLQEEKKNFESHLYDTITPPILWEQDALEFLRGLPAKSVDLVITQPPARDSFKSDDKYREFVFDWTSMLPKVMKDTGNAYIVLDTNLEDLYVYLHTFHYKTSPSISNILYWSYTPYRRIGKYKSAHTPILYLKNKKSKLTLGTSSDWDSFNFDIDKDHREQLPYQLVNFLVRQGSNEKDLVVDPFAGTGSVLLEAVRLNRTATGCENDPAMTRIAETRRCKIEFKEQQ